MILLVISVFIKGFLALGATVLVLFLIHCVFLKAVMPKEEEFTAQSAEMPIATPSDTEDADIPSLYINKCILPINNKEIINDYKVTADKYKETAYEYKVTVNNYKETVNEYKEAVKYKVNGSEFVEEFKNNDSLVEFEIFAEEVTMSEMDLDYDMYCESPPGSVQSDCEEDTQPLAVTLQEIPHGYIINLTLYLTEHQWHTLIFIDTKSTRCVVCDVYCEIDTCSEHIGTDGHRRNLDKHPPLMRFDLSITRKIRQNYHCAVCNELFHVSDNMDHFGSNLHEGKFLFAINKASDLSFDNDLYDKNETNYKKQVETPKDMSYKFINFQNNYDNFEDEFEIFEPPQPGVSYANMAKTPKVNTQQFIHVDLGNKRVRVRFDSWHMVICPELNRFYCMVCKMFDHVRLKALHCSKADHLKRLELCKVVEAYEEYFIRMVDDKLYHCGHCNNLQLIHEMNDHVETSHPRKTKIITEKVQKTPLKNQESIKENINTINVNGKLNYDNGNTNSGNRNVISENRMISDIRNTFSQNRNTIIDNRNATIANRNTTIDNSDNRNMFSGNRNTTVDNRNMISGNRNTAVDNRNMISENRNTAVDNRYMITENRNTTVDNRNMNSENRNTTVDNRNMISENRNTTVDNRNVFTENRNTTFDNRNISDNRNTNVDNRNVINDNRTVFNENRNTTIENRNVNSDNRNMIVENRNVNDIKNANVPMFKTNLQQNGQFFSKMAGIFDSTVIYPFGSKLSIPILSYNVINKRQTDFYCGICIFVCSEDLVLSHIYEMRHIEMLQRTPFISPFNCHLIRAIRDSLHCAICNMSLPAHKIYKHIEDPQHLNLLKKAMSTDPNPTQPLSPFKIQNAQTNVVGNVNSLREDLNNASRTSDARPSHAQIPYNIQNAQTNVVFRKEDVNSQKEDLNKETRTSDARPSHAQIPYNINNAQTNVYRKEDNNSQKEDINKASETRPPHVQIPYTIPKTQGYVIRKEGIYSPKEDLTNASRMVEANSSHVPIPYNNQNAQVNVFKIEGLLYPKAGINSPKEDLNKAPKIFDQYNIHIQENATLKTEIDTPKKSLKNTKQDLDKSIDSVDSDYATFDLEEYVYLKLKNTYVKITNTSYNTLVHVGDGSRYCFVCAVQVDFVVLQKHVDSRSHLENMEKYRFLEKYENHLLRQIYLMYHCSVCNVIITKREVKTHLTWPTHYLQNENTIKNIKKQRKNDIKGGIKQIVVSTQKENIFVNEKETKIKIGLNVLITKTAEPKMRKLKIIIVDENVLKVPWESWHGVSKIKNGYKCILCQLELGTSEIETHCVSEWHVSGLDKTFEKQYGSALIRKINDLTLNCLVCNTEVASREDLIIEHISGKKHDKNYEAVLKISSTYNTYTDCDDDVFTV